MPESLSKAAVAEAIGTFALIFVGVLSVAAGPPNLVRIAFAHGLTIAVMVAALGAVSGGHFNPAVTFGFLVTGRLDPFRSAVYITAQLVGATLAALLLVSLFGQTPVGNGTPEVAGDISARSALVLEAVATFFLVLVVFGTAVDERAPKSVFPMAIGLTITVGILAIGGLTGGALNPARAFGPALASGRWSNHLVWWIGPLAGGAAAAFVQHIFLMRRAPSPTVAERGGPAPSEERTQR